MDADGTKEGYDLELVEAVSSAVSIPVIASGGAGKLEHMADVLQNAGADAVLAAGIFHFGQCTIREVKDLFVRRGIPVRPAC
jgi:cyclase